MVTRERLWRVAPPVVVAVVSFVAIRATMLPGVDFWDTGELQTVGPLMGTAHPTGFPTYVLLAWVANIALAPFGEPALRMNILAGLCVAVAAGVTVDLARALTRSVALGLMAGLGLAFTDIVWSIGTHAEAHALHLLLVAVLLRLLVAWEDAVHAVREAPAGAGGDDPGGIRRRRADRLLVAAAIVTGLALGNHSLTLLLGPPIALYVLAVDPAIWRRPRLIAACALATGITLGLVLLELPLRAGPFRAPLVYGHPETWDGFWYIVLAEQFRGSLIAPLADLGPKWASLVARTAASFGPLVVLVPLGFLATAVARPRYALLTGLALAITCFFAASYDNADIGRYYLVPALIAWTWLAMLAAVPVRALAGTDDRAGRPSPWSRPAAALAIVLAVVLLVPTALDLGDRARRVDRSHDLIARSWVDGTLAMLEPGAVVVSWWSYSTPLWYAQHIEGQRPDVTVIDDRTRLDEHLGDIYDVIDANLPTRPVYVIRADPSEIAGLAARYELQPIGGLDARVLTKVLGPRDGVGS